MRAKLLVFVSLVLSLAGVVRAGDSYAVDSSHSQLGFAVKHLGLSTTRGQFKDYTMDLKFNEKDPTKSTIKVVIQAASIDTADAKRDGHLKNADFFDVEKYPTLTFQSTKIEKTGEKAYNLLGKFTIKDVTKDVVIPFTLEGPVKDPWGLTRLAVEGSLVINRQDYHVSYDPTGLGVGNEVKINLTAEFTKVVPAKKK
jgi:polyisoprenoid-binding protein YceI